MPDVSIVGLNEASETLLDKFAVHDKPEEIEKNNGRAINHVRDTTISNSGRNWTVLTLAMP